MALFCLPKNLTTIFREKLKSGELNPGELADMSSEKRREIFAFLGEKNAREVNAVFESKLLLKDQQRGMITWAKKFANEKPAVVRDLLSRIQKLDTVLNPKEADAFLEDLAAHKLGATVTMEEAGQISELAKQVSVKREAMDNGGDRLEYGRANVKLNNYVNDLKEGARVRTVGETTLDVINSTKALRASMDNSYIGRQGIKAMWTHPTIWAKHAKDSFKRMYQEFGGKNTMDEVNADIVSRENYLNGNYKKMGLAVGKLEEAFPTTLPEKIPGYKRAYKASESAFTSQAYLTRVDIADLYIKKAIAGKVDLNDIELKRIGSLVNSITGRGYGGSSGSSKVEKVVNATFFSPRYLVSNIRTFTDPITGAGGSSFVRKQAAINLLKIVSGTAAVMATANAFDDDAVEFDPRSSDFGRIKAGSTRFDITGGMASIITLASRLLTLSSKSTTTGVVKKLNTGEFGSQTGWDVVVDFSANKLSPVAGILRDYLKGETFSGEKPVLWKEALSLATPIGFDNAVSLLQEPDGAPFLATMILDGLGFGQSTYSSKTNWSRNPGVELKSFQKEVGDQKFQEANDLFNKQYNDWLKEMKSNKEFQALPDEQKQTVSTNKKGEIKDNIFKDYGFKYKKAKVVKTPKF